MVITEAIILAIITIIGGGVIAIGKSFVEGKALADIEEIKSRAEDLEERLAEAEIEYKDFKTEVKSLEKEIVDLEIKLASWKRRYWRLQVESQELKMVFLRVMERADIPTDQFELLVERIKKDAEDCED